MNVGSSEGGGGVTTRLRVVQHINFLSCSRRQACACCSLCLPSLLMPVFDQLFLQLSFPHSLQVCCFFFVGKMGSLHCVYEELSGVGGKECMHVYYRLPPPLG